MTGISGQAPFLDAVAHQAAHRLGEPSDVPGPEDRERHCRHEAERIIALAEEPAMFDGAAVHLAGDTTMLAAFFQNLDLLSASAASSDAVARLVGRALEFSAEMKSP